MQLGDDGTGCLKSRHPCQIQQRSRIWEMRITTFR